MSGPRMFRTPRKGRLTAGSLLAVLLVALMSYVAFAATQHAGSWTIFAYDDRVQNTADDKHVDVSGNENIVQGDIKSNGDAHVSGNDNAFSGLFRFYDPPFNEPGDDNSYLSGEPQQENFSGWPGNLGSFDEPDCDFGNRSDNNDLDLETSDPPGVYCRGNAKVVVKEDGGVGQFTILTNGEINVADEGVDLVPDTNGILFYSQNNLIDWSGNLGSAEGLIFAPSSIIKIQGNENEFCAQFASRTFQLSGNENVFGDCAIPSATPTPTPEATPTPTPEATPTPSPTPAGSPDPTPTPTPPPGATPTPSPTPAGSPDPTPTPTPPPGATPTPTPAGAPDPTPTPTPFLPDTASMPVPGKDDGSGGGGGLLTMLVVLAAIAGAVLLLRPTNQRMAPAPSSGPGRTPPPERGVMGGHPQAPKRRR
jgi:hypothetical protein